MGWIIVRSPHDASEVKVREQDLGRSVRDGQKRIFYLLKDSEGEYYSSLTRGGGPDQEAAYKKILSQESHAKAVASEVTAQAIHDATGKGRNNLKGKLVALFFIILIVGGAWAIFFGPLKNVVWTNPPKIEQTDEEAESTPKTEEASGETPESTPNTPESTPESTPVSPSE